MDTKVHPNKIQCLVMASSPWAASNNVQPSKFANTPDNANAKNVPANENKATINCLQTCIDLTPSES